MGTQKKVVYIAGKVTGEKIADVTMKFGEAQRILKESGFEPINPLQVVNDWHCPWEQAMRKCIKALMTADAVYALPCSSNSKGAALEMHICTELTIPLFATTKGLKAHFIETKCLHPREHQFIDVIASNINCETTVIRCAVCRKELTEPKTDCV